MTGDDLLERAASVCMRKVIKENGSSGECKANKTRKMVMADRSERSQSKHIISVRERRDGMIDRFGH